MVMFSFVVQVLSGIGGLTSFLDWLGIRPQHLQFWRKNAAGSEAVTIQSPTRGRKKQLVAALSLFALSIGSSVYTRLSASTWLAIADDDANSMEGRCIFIGSYPRMHLSAPEPYFDLEISLVNATVFQITYDGRTEGYLTYRNEPLGGKTTVVPAGFSFKHGDGVQFAIRQFVSPQVAQEISREQKPTVDLGHLTIFFSYKDRHGELRSLPWKYNQIRLYVPAT